MHNQRTRVLEYINKKGGITSLEAFKELGVSRLSAVIFDLKEKGYNIKDVWIVVTNRYGEETKVKRYYLDGVKTNKWFHFFVR